MIDRNELYRNVYKRDVRFVGWKEEDLTEDERHLYLYTPGDRSGIKE